MDAQPEDSFNEFYRSSRQRVVTFLLAMTGDRAEAQDTAQEAYVRAWQRWSAVGGYDDPEAWVRTVAYRLSISRWRKARNRLVAHRLYGVREPVAPPDENTVALVAALKLLPEVDREAVTLHHLLDLSVADIARQTGTPANTIKARLVRGRNRLATLLGRDLSGEITHA
ncbi:SigE family RNA polymerase sigma factor [Dactylosporangium sp. NPDC005555]|uniref:RNA polymerase sigma factor n=1 Tax=Dactylosporangium sp. NPDC005555 TaxID=3154889 RepID=UPI0033AE0B92